MLRGSREWVGFGFLALVALYGLIPSIILGLHNSIPPCVLAEDGPYEMLGAVFCIFASILLISAAAKTKPRNAWFMLFALGTLFLALEELSWGQRLLGFSLPEKVQAINFQGELNLHNSKFLQPENGNLSFLLRVGYLLYFVALPLGMMLFPSLRRFTEPSRIPIPSTLVFAAVLVAHTINALNVSALSQAGILIAGSHIGEAYESNLQLILLFFALECWWSTKHSRPVSQTE